MKFVACSLCVAVVCVAPALADEMDDQLDAIKATLERLQTLTPDEQRGEYAGLLTQTSGFLDEFAGAADEASLVLVSNLTFQLLEVTE
ncbi:MAG: hypothetical protein KDD82_19335, partial [Planctomycetes bacterium]|nr:hypothetical protein [Planctomycetota bacterium]